MPSSSHFPGSTHARPLRTTVVLAMTAVLALPTLVPTKPVVAEVPAAPPAVVAPTLPSPADVLAQAAAAPDARQAVAPVRPETAGGWTPPVDAEVTSGFGTRTHPISGSARHHDGFDYPAPGGTTIRAVADGVVASAAWQGGYGTTVVIDHGGGLTTLYAHQSTTAVAAGQPVGAGDVIGAVGSTGASTGAHLHLEVRIDDTAVDPAAYLATH